jgi:phosphinothricin acetyltransferase
MSNVKIRPASPGDAVAIAAIYGEAVTTGTGTFDLEVPSVDDFARRIAALRLDGYPFLAAMRGGDVVGYAYAGAFRARGAFAATVEDSIYLTPGARGQGLGGRLLSALIEACQSRGYRQMLALIGDSANAASIALHRRQGFADAGLLREVGFKHGRWLDVVVMQRALGPTSGRP